MKVGLVSSNTGKLKELRALLPDWEIELLDTAGIGDETGATFHENARAKALWGRSRARSDSWVLGEDSGLEVAGIGGRPGIHSARYAGVGATDQENVEKLLRELHSAAGADRRARYVCELVLIDPSGQEVRGTGTLDGMIAGEPRGSSGFGYDPVFIPLGETSSVAVLGEDWKAAHSHRAEAVQALVEALSALSSAN